MNGRIPKTMIIVFILIGSCIMFTDQDEFVDGVGEPNITIRLANTKATARVAPGQDGIAVFTGTVEASAPWSPTIQRIVVTLQADAGGWAVTNPAPLQFTKHKTSQPFSITVQVPIGTSSGGAYNLIISGTWEYDPGVNSGEVDPVTAIIYVEQYYRLELYCDESSKEAEVGDRVEYFVEIINTGNGADRAKVEVTNTDELRDEGIRPIMSNSEFAIDENASEIVVIVVEVSASTRLDTYYIDLIAYSLDAEEFGISSESGECTLFLYVVREKTEVEEPEPEEPEPEEPPAEEPETEPEPKQEDDEGNVMNPQDNPDNEEQENDTKSDEDGNNTIIVVGTVVVISTMMAILIGTYMLVKRSSRKKP